MTPNLTLKQLGIAHIWCLALAGLGLLCGHSLAQAQEGVVRKGQPITLVAPYPAGGGSDLTARMVAQRLEVLLDQPVAVVNRPGAETEIAMRFVASAKPDGLTLLLGVPTIVTNPLFHEASPNWRPQLQPVAKLTEIPMLMLARKNLAVNDYAGLLRAVQARRIDRVNCGASGASTTLGCLFLQYQLGESVVSTVTYKGNAPALADLTGGHIDVLFDLISTAKPAVEGGLVKALAKTTPKPLPAPFADLPATSEELPDFVLNAWQGIFAPAGLPPATLDRLEKALSQIMKDAQAPLSFNSVGVQVAFLGSVPFGRFLDEERKRYEKLVVKLN